MARLLQRAALLLLAASLASAQYGSYSPPASSSNNGASSSSPTPSASPAAAPSDGEAAKLAAFYAYLPTVLTSHAVLATLTWGLLLPVGGILIRVATFRGAWIAHAVIQVLALVLFTAAAGIGIYMGMNLQLLTDPHVVIGLILFVLMFVQPLSGLVHHNNFVKRGGRGAWSHAHIWAGRVMLTLGIINGGLGIRLTTMRGFAPPMADVVVYGVLAGIMWLLYVASVVYGERRRSMTASKEEYSTRPMQQKEGNESESA